MGKKYLAYWYFDEARRRFNTTTQMWELRGPAELKESDSRRTATSITAK